MEKNYVEEQEKKPLNLIKYCAIYVRVSNEAQADKVSPQEQEKDCKELANQKGYIVVEIYRDIQPYRGSNGKMRQCAAYHWDRPAWLKMIADAKAGKFGTILAWKEDRLYRGVNKALLDFSSLVTDFHINVELVKDYYDVKTAAVKAWAAGMEIQARHDRTTMGVKAKLSRGEHWNSGEIFGYRFNKETDHYDIYEPEAVWIRLMFQWFANGITLSEIANRLNANDVPRSTIHKNQQKYGWHSNIVHKILDNDYYYTGIRKMTWDGETYEQPFDLIISNQKVVKAFLKRRSDYKAYPNGATKKPVLSAGLVFCNACNVRMHLEWSIGTKEKRLLRNTENASDAVAHGYYRCPRHKAHIANEHCVKYIGTEKIDNELWSKLWSFLSNSSKMKFVMAKKVAELQTIEKISDTEMGDIEEKLKNNQEERKEVINLRRKKLITEDDLAQQLQIISEEETALKRQLSEVKISSSFKSEKLNEMIDVFTHAFNDGYSWLNEPPKDDEEEEHIFKAKQKIVNALIKRISVFENRTFEIEMEFNLNEVIDDINKTNGSGLGGNNSDDNFGNSVGSSRWSESDTNPILINGTPYEQLFMIRVVL